MNSILKLFNKILKKDTSLEKVTLVSNEGDSVVVRIVTQLSKGTFTREVRYKVSADKKSFEYVGKVH